MKNILLKLDISKKIAEHLHGENHTHIHHKLVGLAIMIFGVLVAKVIPNLFHFDIIHYCADVVGFGLHGVGLVPFLHTIEKVS